MQSALRYGLVYKTRYINTLPFLSLWYEEGLFVQEDVFVVDENIKHGRLLSAKQQARRSVSDDNRLQQQHQQHQQHQQLPAIITHHLSQVKADATLTSHVSIRDLRQTLLTVTVFQSLRHLLINFMKVVYLFLTVHLYFCYIAVSYNSNR